MGRAVLPSLRQRGKDKADRLSGGGGGAAASFFVEPKGVSRHPTWSSTALTEFCI